MKEFEWTVEFTVDETWVKDGFNLTEEKALEMLNEILPYADAWEIGAKIIKAPKQSEIKQAQKA